ncbi:MAG: CmpX protein [uncultured bacterium]|uniref:CmpX protein n=2 Tax=Candidatus Wolfeibacteriota TaxID=1752735 RepID=A0A0G1K6M2_9BACT|nr:MAG: CmpX protein [uncultured bacterium]KKR12553.1 MAG: CmpX protein [Candidatus Wolfebacteria bacterium GW2011_GWC2_39_22]KKT43509.1 MAG: CmpX protein [Candidatus Wolfebacteria bacterium GW2011_GWE2_44_13]HBI25754.1 hypothetical protein [Candidatus Wolfebacteria bacterium]
MFVQNLTSTLYGSLASVWLGVMAFMPKFIGALIVLIIGLVIASVFGSVIEQIIKSVKLDGLLKKIGVSQYIDRSGVRLDSGRFLGRIVYWFFAIVSILAVSNILGLDVFSDFLKQVLLYVPNIVVAALIMLATLVVARFSKTLVVASVATAKLHAANFLGSFVWWIIVVFGLITSLMQLGINVYVLQTVITGVVAMLAIAGGIAFGLGGKDYAASLIEKLRKDTAE